MRIADLIAKLEPIAKADPDMIVLIGRGEQGWFDEVEDIGTCRINCERDGLNCGPHEVDDDGNEEVVVIH